MDKPINYFKLDEGPTEAEKKIIAQLKIIDQEHQIRREPYVQMLRNLRKLNL